MFLTPYKNWKVFREQHVRLRGGGWYCKTIPVISNSLDKISKLQGENLYIQIKKKTKNKNKYLHVMHMQQNKHARKRAVRKVLTNERKDVVLQYIELPC